MNCDINEKTMSCRICGGAVTSTRVKRNCRPGLGDRVASALASVGITTARAQAVANAFGVDDCGCDGRRDALNRLGRDYLGIGGEPQGPAP